tara:strand:+ start:340 stop:486 length:147 start_codon:yes stop_codon:yes gene_type:complete
MVTILDKCMMVLEIVIAFWVVWLICKTERDDPTELIVPATDEDVELVK